MIPAKRYQINKPTVVHEKIDNEVVIIEFDSGNYYSLDDVAADIWNLIEAGATEREIIENVLILYKASHQEVVDSVTQFISELQKEKLIIPDDIHGVDTKQNARNNPRIKPGVEKSQFKNPTLHKYSDMQELLLLDPIHEVDERGWPSVKLETADE